MADTGGLEAMKEPYRLDESENGPELAYISAIGLHLNRLRSGYDAIDPQDCGRVWKRREWSKTKMH